jgi:hypothetical protein
VRNIELQVHLKHPGSDTPFKPYEKKQAAVSSWKESLGTCQPLRHGPDVGQCRWCGVASFSTEGWGICDEGQLPVLSMILLYISGWKVIMIIIIIINYKTFKDAQRCLAKPTYLVHSRWLTDLLFVSFYVDINWLNIILEIWTSGWCGLFLWGLRTRMPYRQRCCGARNRTHAR